MPNNRYDYVEPNVEAKCVAECARSQRPDERECSQLADSIDRARRAAKAAQQMSCTRAATSALSLFMQLFVQHVLRSSAAGNAEQTKETVMQ